MSGHDQHRVVATGTQLHGWQGAGWRAECKSCPWTGPVRLHPLDCGEDTARHYTRTRETVATPTVGSSR